MKRILVIHRGSLGDFLLLLPALAVMRKFIPRSHLELLGRTEILSLACPGIAQAISSADRASLVPFFECSDNLPRREVEFFSSFDTVIAYVSDPSRTLEHNLERMGIQNCLVRPPFPPAGRRVHVGHYLMETIAPLVDNPVATSSGPLFNFDDQGIRQAQNFLRSVRRSGRPIVGAHPGSGSWKKCWPAERFETLIHALKDDLGCEVLLMLGPADEHLATRFKPLAAKLGCVIAENLPLRSLAAVLSLCDAYIGNDSGVTHLAALTGIPTLAIFGPTDPVVWAPSGLKVRVVAGVAHCAPCNREIMTRCERQICLEAISVQQMTHLIGDILAVVLGDNAPQDSR